MSRARAAKVVGPVTGNILLLDISGDGQREVAIASQNAVVSLLHASDDAADDADADAADDSSTSTTRAGAFAEGWPVALPGFVFRFGLDGGDDECCCCFLF